MVIAPIGQHRDRLAAWPARLAPHRRNRVQQRQQLGDVARGAAGQRDRQRDAVRVDDQVVLGAGTATVDR